MPGDEGRVCAFELPSDGSPLVVEADTGRTMFIAPGDVFLATPGYRESTRWVVGGVPPGGLGVGDTYWVLAQSGVVGELIGDSPLEKSHLGRVKYLGAIRGDDGGAPRIGDFAAKPNAGGADSGAPVFLVVGTSAEVGKTTAAIAVLRALRQQGNANVVALKATGTSSIAELTTYQDYGASQTFDCVDFGLPTTYPSDRDGIDRIFESALDTCLSIPADAVLVECGGDMLGANVPVFLDCLKRRRADPRVVLAAADALGALGGIRVLDDMGLTVSLIAGPCTDTPTLQQRTQALCGVPAMNMTKGGGIGALL
jgi:Domain of unknown function (DUF1611_C) P-loop domain